MMSVLVLGLGNPLRGDDGIGSRLVEELAHRGLPEDVTALDGGTGGLDLLHVLEGWKRAVIVDAADVGQEPGRFVRFTLDEARLAQATDSFSLHQAGLSEALALAEALGCDLWTADRRLARAVDVGWVRVVGAAGSLRR